MTSRGSMLIAPWLCLASLVRVAFVTLVLFEQNNCMSSSLNSSPQYNMLTLRIARGIKRPGNARVSTREQLGRRRRSMVVVRTFLRWNIQIPSGGVASGGANYFNSMLTNDWFAC